jgi:hypothetical protein
MSVQTAGEVVVDVDRTAAFAFLQDPTRLSVCIPGCRDVREIAPGRYSAVLTNRVAFMTVSFNTVIEITRLEPPSAIDATMKGDAIGLAGHMAATVTVLLVEEAPDRTIIRYATDVALTGRLGGLGQPVFQATSTRLAREFGANLKQAIEAERTSHRT